MSDSGPRPGTNVPLDARDRHTWHAEVMCPGAQHATTARMSAARCQALASCVSANMYRGLATAVHKSPATPLLGHLRTAIKVCNPGDCMPGTH